jgi:uracil-DNA glycosylase
MLSLPSHPPNDLFETRFDPHLALPGFFPGAGGFFHGHPNPKKRFLFFGTDFGSLSYQRGLPRTGGEPEGVVTLRQLRWIVAQAGLPPDHCFLTNAVLCMRLGESATGKFPIWRTYRDYVLACAAWHRREIAESRPTAVVLMGRPHLEHFGKLLFPELANHWRGLKSMANVYAQRRETLTLADRTHVLLMLHPSFWHAHPKELKDRAVQHLADWASTDAYRK